MLLGKRGMSMKKYKVIL